MIISSGIPTFGCINVDVFMLMIGGFISTFGLAFD